MKLIYASVDRKQQEELSNNIRKWKTFIKILLSFKSVA